VDTRLTRLDGIRVAPLLRSDLEPVALAITDALQGRTQIRRDQTRGVEAVELSNSSYHVVILASEWDLILPYLKDGYFQPEVYPTPRQTDRITDSPSDLVSNQLYPLYQRVLVTLQMLFPGDWPGSTRR
jgi:hypothetical protein